MKKILIIIALFMFTITGYAQIYKRSESGNGGKAPYQSGSVYKSSSSSKGEISSGALYRSSNDDDPGGRPGGGEGIGQEAPLGDGFYALAICCLVYGIIKLASKRAIFRGGLKRIMSWRVKPATTKKT